MPQKLYLFDIDTTLLSPGPIARKLISAACNEIVGKPVNLELSDVMGMTDPVIIRNALKRLEVNNNLDFYADLVLERYLDKFEPAYNESQAPHVYEDALTLLEKVEQKGHLTGLLTGNVKRGAKIKLDRFDLFNRFPMGVFGDDGSTRSDLPAVAYERARKVFGKRIEFKDMVIVGDSVHDARIAIENGIYSIIVCRKPEWRLSLEKAGADLVVDTFTDPQIIIPDSN